MYNKADIILEKNYCSLKKIKINLKHEKMSLQKYCDNKNNEECRVYECLHLKIDQSCPSPHLSRSPILSSC